MSRLSLRFAAAFCLILLPPSPALASNVALSGQATVIDGDTIELAGTRIRLVGIDAPEAAQSCERSGAAWSCGQHSSEQLRALVGQNPVQCTGQQNDIYGRLLAKCSVGGRDIGRELVQWGLAVSYDDSDPVYTDAEARARAHKLGLWASRFDRPADWRAAHPRNDAGLRFAEQTRVTVHRARQAASADLNRVYRTALGCAIKGNQSYRGDWIYYLPGTKYYDETRPEGLFCTERQAQAAGYRRSRAD